MNADALRTLIGARETLAVEFKGEERAALNDRDRAWRTRRRRCWW
jgi:hypothetical protein